MKRILLAAVMAMLPVFASATDLPQLNQSVNQQTAVTTPDISRYNGQWTANGRLHFSNPKIKCGYQIVYLSVFDGQVKGHLKIGSGHFRDSAAGDYPFGGTIDQNGNVEANGHGVSIAGSVSQDASNIQGSWDAHGVACHGTFQGTREF